jgi:citrate lyase subunit beta/citryl-CoA lyase
VAAFEAARAAGEARVELDGSLVEMPTYSNAKRLLARADALRQFE